MQRCRAERGRGRRAASTLVRWARPKCRGAEARATAARPRYWSRSEHHVVDVLGVRCWQQDHNLGNPLTASCLPSNIRARCASSVSVRCAARRLVGGSGRSPACVWLLREAALGRGAGVPAFRRAEVRPAEVAAVGRARGESASTRHATRWSQAGPVLVVHSDKAAEVPSCGSGTV